MEGETLDLTPLYGVLDQYKAQRGAVIPVLQKAQEVCGRPPREVLEVIGRKMKVPMGEIYGVVAFYSQFYLTRRGSGLGLGTRHWGRRLGGHLGSRPRGTDSWSVAPRQSPAGKIPCRFEFRTRRHRQWISARSTSTPCSESARVGTFSATTPVASAMQP